MFPKNTPVLVADNLQPRMCNKAMLCVSRSQTDAGLPGCYWSFSCCWFWSYSGGSGLSAAPWSVPADVQLRL